MNTALLSDNRMKSQKKDVHKNKFSYERKR